MAKSIHIGTSGWHYRGWIGDFYPADMRPAGFLAHYLRHFRTVELNNSFYRLPAAETLGDWHDAVPAGFRFAVKASRFITHNKKLKDGEASFRVFFERMRILGTRMGPILFQLPPLWHYNPERLETFLAALPKGIKPVFEFRHESWFNDECYSLLRRFRTGLCIYHWNRYQSPIEVTARTVYVRFHGTRGKYGGSYNPRALGAWAKRMREWSEGGREVWAYFNNDSEGAAPHNALALKALLEA